MSKQKEPKKRRRARGSGSIFADARRGWVGRIPIGTYSNGSTKYLTRSAPTQRELLVKLKEAKPPGPETTVAQLCARWLDQVDVRAASHDSYEQSVRLYITPALGHVRVRDLAGHQIDVAVRKWASDTSPNNAYKALDHLSACLEYAVRCEVLTRNPAKTARKPKRTKKQIDPFTPGELAKIIATATAQPTLRIFAVLAAVGCRSGEAMGLDVGDWNPMTKTIAITKTQRMRGRGVGPPKSKHSTRTIRLPRSAVPAVVDAIGIRRNGPLFPGPTGKRQGHTTVDVRWKKLLRLAAIPYRNPHQMRHGVATLLVSNGVPLGDVAKYLGDSVAVVVSTYLHATGADPADTLDTLLDAVR